MQQLRNKYHDYERLKPITESLPLQNDPQAEE